PDRRADQKPVVRLERPSLLAAVHTGPHQFRSQKNKTSRCPFPCCAMRSRFRTLYPSNPTGSVTGITLMSAAESVHHHFCPLGATWAYREERPPLQAASWQSDTSWGRGRLTLTADSEINGLIGPHAGRGIGPRLGG